MATVLLAVSNGFLRNACGEILRAAGHAVIEISQPVELLSAARLLHAELCCVDDSEIGHATLTVANGGEAHVAVIFIGKNPPEGVIAVGLPLEDNRLLEAVERAMPDQQRAPAALASTFRFDRERRVAAIGESEVWLTRTQARLLAFLIDSSPAPVSTADVLREVWGYEEGTADPELVRTHVRNLRAKLAEIGLPDAVRSQRGHGYRFALRAAQPPPAGNERAV